MKTQAKATIHFSKYFSNLQYEMFYNGGSRTVMNNNEVLGLVVDRAYSPVELFKDSPLAVVGTMFEMSLLMNKGDQDAYYKAIIRDAQYNMECWEHAIECLKYLSYYRQDNIVSFYLEFDKSADTIKGIRVSSRADAITLLNMYKKLKHIDNGRVCLDYTLEQNKSITNFMRGKVRRLDHFLSKGVLNKEVFTLPCNPHNESPLEEMDYYNWLDKNVKDLQHNSIETRREYLKSIGFNAGLHKLSKLSISALKWCLIKHFDHKKSLTL